MIAKREWALKPHISMRRPIQVSGQSKRWMGLAKIVARYSGPIKLNVINFTDIQLARFMINAPILLMITSGSMMKISEELAEQSGYLGLITGESIGQVASQTMQSLAATNEVYYAACIPSAHRI